jgi:adenosylcobinamide kinase/adenosylcobinamide-phosphate guanylyltransferase
VPGGPRQEPDPTSPPCYIGRVSTSDGRNVLVGGGARSGKSAFALSYARRLGERRVFLATGEALDDEMSARIRRHRAERGGAFLTVEEPRDLPGALARLEDADVVVVDCLTLWLSNLLVAGTAADEVRARIDDLAEVLARRRFNALLVTNEVGMGIVPETALGRLFRDLAGWAHQRLAAAADEIYLAALGVVLRLHPAPVERFS